MLDHRGAFSVAFAERAVEDPAERVELAGELLVTRVRLVAK